MSWLERNSFIHSFNFSRLKASEVWMIKYFLCKLGLCVWHHFILNTLTCKRRAWCNFSIKLQNINSWEPSDRITDHLFAFALFPSPIMICYSSTANHRACLEHLEEFNKIMFLVFQIRNPSWASGCILVWAHLVCFIICTLCCQKEQCMTSIHCFFYF